MNFLIQLISVFRTQGSVLLTVARSWLWQQDLKRLGCQISGPCQFKKGSRIVLHPEGKLVMGKNIQLSEWARLYIGKGATLIIEDDVFIGFNSTVIANHYVKIGEGTQIAHQVSIIDSDHDQQQLSQKNPGAVGASGPICIDKFCWVGAHSIILKGVQIGEYAIVGAGAIVTKSVPSKYIAKGKAAEAQMT